MHTASPQSDSCTIEFTSLQGDGYLRGHLVCMSCDVQLKSDRVLTVDDDCDFIIMDIGMQGSKF